MEKKRKEKNKIGADVMIRKLYEKNSPEGRGVKK